MSTQPTSTRSLNLRGAKILFAFVSLGFVLSLLTYYISSDFERFNVPLAVLLVLGIPVATAVGVVGLRQGLRHFSELRASWTWWHWLLFLLFVSTLVFRIRDVQAATAEPVDAWALLRLGPEAIVAGVLINRLISRRTSWLRPMFRGLLGALTIYGLVSAVSSTWSVYSAWTLYKSLEFLLDVAVLSAILCTVETAAGFRQVFNFVYCLYALELGWTWVNAALWPSEALDELGRLSGIWPVTASNSIGIASAIVFIVALARLIGRSAEKSERAWYGLALAFGFVSLVASQTRNSMAGLVFGIALLLWYERRKWIGFAGIAVTVPLLLFTSLGAQVATYLARSQTETQIEGMSSRMDWWTFAWQQFMHHPLTGLGAYAAGKFAVLGKMGVGTASQMHSDWMEVLAGTSFWGLAPFVVALLGCWWFLGRSYWDRDLEPEERQLAGEALAILGIISLRSFFNVELSWHAPFLFLVVLGYAEFLRRKKKQRKANESVRAAELNL
jgi:O-antigen ligase